MGKQIRDQQASFSARECYIKYPVCVRAALLWPSYLEGALQSLVVVILHALIASVNRTSHTGARLKVKMKLSDYYI